MEEFDMSKGTCKVPECDRPRKSRGWCHAHYMYWYEGHGEPSGPVRKWGQSRSEKCSVAGCDLPYESIGFCAPHRKRLDRLGNPGAAAITPKTVGDDACYDTAHQRIRAKRGPASAQRCVSCDSTAQQWAYDHTDEAEKFDSRGYAFSLDISRYRPMCVSCHKRFDLDHISASRRYQFVSR